jgi:UDP-N-acetylmuramoyl-L-alanyl-D-glutamate--2,6-diaminopimelate ligase
MALTLLKLAQTLHAELHGDPDVVVTHVTADSRQATKGSLFVAVRGSSGDGHAWLSQAIASGCSAVVVEHEAAVNVDVPCLIVEQTRSAPALVARLLFDNPDLALQTAGVTGTNGKTTTASLLRSMLQELNTGCGLLGTIQYETGLRTIAAPLTTPGGPEFYRALAEMRDSDLSAVAMEISSHALDQQRTAGLELDVAVMTNLSRDHLDYHGDLKSYLAAKLRIVELLAGPDRTKKPGVLALNADDPAFADVAPHNIETWRWSTGWRREPLVQPDVFLHKQDLRSDGTTLVLDIRGEMVELESSLVGRFNVENLCAAMTAGVALGYDPALCAKALSRAGQVAGRMEGFVLPNGAVAVVDYAHTPDALQAVLASCRELTRGKVIVVFGCGGDRDRGKRPQMGAVAAKYADVAWITSDNPRSEEPAAICAEIMDGYRASSSDDQACRLEVNRKTAIVGALSEAGSGDVVVIAGKGHEDYQIIGNQRLDFDDRAVVRDYCSGEGQRD